MSGGGHDDGKAPGFGAWPFANLFQFPFQPFGSGFQQPQPSFPQMPPWMQAGWTPGMPPMTGSAMPGFAMPPMPGFPMPAWPFQLPGHPAQPAAAAPPMGKDGISAPFMQQMMRVNLELFALITRRTRAMMEAPQRFSQCRTIDDLSREQSLYMSEMLADFTTANQRVMAIWAGSAVPAPSASHAVPPSAAEAHRPSAPPEPAPAAPAAGVAAVVPMAHAPSPRRRTPAKPPHRKKPRVAAKPRMRRSASKSSARRSSPGRARVGGTKRRR